MKVYRDEKLFEYCPTHFPTLSVIATTELHPTREQIETRAYELYLKRGCVPGYVLQDWLQAERE